MHCIRSAATALKRLTGPGYGYASYLVGHSSMVAAYAIASRISREPAGEKGEKIPLGARVLAVADAYDAMTSARLYREAIRWEDAVRELVAARGSQLDPEVVNAFLRALAPDLIPDYQETLPPHGS